MYINLNNRKNIEMDEDKNYCAKARRTVLICYGHKILKLSQFPLPHSGFPFRVIIMKKCHIADGKDGLIKLYRSSQTYASAARARFTYNCKR